MSPTSVNVIPTKTTVIDYGPDTSSHYPTLMKLKAVDKEIAMLTKSYETVNETSIMNIRQGHVLAAIENMEEMKQINDMLLAAVAQGKELLEKAIPKGSIDQKIVAREKPRLDNIIDKAMERKREIAQLEVEMLNINGDLKNTELDQKSNWLQFVVLVVLGVIVVGLTAKTMVDDKVSNIDNAILAIVIGILIYYLIKKYM